MCLCRLRLYLQELNWVLHQRNTMYRTIPASVLQIFSHLLGALEWNFNHVIVNGGSAVTMDVFWNMNWEEVHLTMNSYKSFPVITYFLCPRDTLNLIRNFHVWV